jgi:hypothetical protein
MLSILIALIVLAVAVGAIYLTLKNMGEDGIEVAAPGSCKSGRCGVRCAPVTNERDKAAGVLPDDTDEARRKDAA